jgi:hypothetical protein
MTDPMPMNRIWNSMTDPMSMNRFWNSMTDPMSMNRFWNGMADPMSMNKFWNGMTDPLSMNRFWNGMTSHFFSVQILLLTTPRKAEVRPEMCQSALGHPVHQMWRRGCIMYVHCSGIFYLLSAS